MTQALSQDLRNRVIAAVDGGMSCNGAAERFGIAVSSAVRWVRAWRAEGRAEALPQGGDLRSRRIEAFRDVVLAAIEAQKDITLAELVALLRREHGAAFAISTMHRHLVRHRITLKKKPRTPPSRTGRTWPADGRPGSTRSLTSIPHALVFIDETGALDQDGATAGPGTAWRALSGGCAARALENHDLRGVRCALAA